MLNQHSILFILLLTTYTQSLFSQQPTFEFIGLNLTQKHKPYSMILSQDQQKIAIHFLNATTQLPQYKILRFDGTQRCRKRLSQQEILIAWPKGQNLIFINNSDTSLSVLNTDCDDPVQIANYTSKIKGVKFSSRDTQTYAAVLTQQNKIYQYNLASRVQNRRFSIQGNDKLMSYQYSQNHRYLFMQSSVKGMYNESVIRAYETDTGNKVQQMNSSYMMVKVINNGGNYLAIDNSNLYKLDTNGNVKHLIQFTQYDEPLDFCTKDNVLVSLKTILYEQQEKKLTQLVIYNTDSGDVLQTINLDYTPIEMNLNIMACNEDFLAFMDQSGMIKVYRYKYEFGVWIIVVSVIGAVFVIAVILGIVIVMRNKRKQHKKQQYKRFEQQNNNADTFVSQA